MQKVITISLILCLFHSLAHGQKSLDNVNGLNQIKLNQTLQDYQESLYLISGDEPVYKNNNSTRESLKRNIKNGIREGVYKEHSHLFIDGKKASKLNMIFYKGELYKIRWTFRKGDFKDLASLAKFLNQHFTEQFGHPKEVLFGDTYIWEEDKNYLQAFLDQTEYQIELRDKQIDRIV
ncbi:hypothetical protein IFO69_21250 [Echinicola sp. CAU 1574]|uniref:Uncharacterized protein n=1 Tax=Echinicola arenosa TaxID=2774144 RepID=A0ABR9AR84_9BACT|nr:hypothetical protein [Echinicola arenosa]MBD8491293.1 hypothetical protein [Echinicola arenosa]